MIASARYGRAVEAINQLFTQEEQNEHITRSPCIPVDSGYVQGSHYFFGGLPLVMETFRALGLQQSIKKHLSIFKDRLSMKTLIMWSLSFRSLLRGATAPMILRG
jgi:hypothetical protein